MTDYQKGMASIPALILIVGAIALVIWLLILLFIKMNSPSFYGPCRLFDKNDELKYKYMSNRVSSAANFLEAESGWRLFWAGGWGMYVVRVPRSGIRAKITEEQNVANLELERNIRKDYQVYLKTLHGQEIY